MDTLGTRNQESIEQACSPCVRDPLPQSVTTRLGYENWECGETVLGMSPEAYFEVPLLREGLQYGPSRERERSRRLRQASLLSSPSTSL